MDLPRSPCPGRLPSPLLSASRPCAATLFAAASHPAPGVPENALCFGFIFTLSAALLFFLLLPLISLTKGLLQKSQHLTSSLSLLPSPVLLLVAQGQLYFSLLFGKCP